MYTIIYCLYIFVLCVCVCYACFCGNRARPRKEKPHLDESRHTRQTVVVVVVSVPSGVSSASIAAKQTNRKPSRLRSGTGERVNARPHKHICIVIHLHTYVYTQKHTQPTEMVRLKCLLRKNIRIRRRSSACDVCMGHAEERVCMLIWRSSIHVV